jgi:hypothetical protein
MRGRWISLALLGLVGACDGEQPWLAAEDIQVVNRVLVCDGSARAGQSTGVCTQDTRLAAFTELVHACEVGERCVLHEIWVGASYGSADVRPPAVFEPANVKAQEGRQAVEAAMRARRAAVTEDSLPSTPATVVTSDIAGALARAGDLGVDGSRASLLIATDGALIIPGCPGINFETRVASFDALRACLEGREEQANLSMFDEVVFCGITGEGRTQPETRAMRSTLSSLVVHAGGVKPTFRLRCPEP